MSEFNLVSDFKPRGDQPKAIEVLVEGLSGGERFQTLLGVTGSGKTFTMANVVASVQKPALVMAPNKTLAAQLYSEFKELFPDNAVEYFVSYYDYYQPEAYLPATDTYISKDADINREIDKLRHSATRSLLDREDVLVVASVSCIYNLGGPKEYEEMSLKLSVGVDADRKELIKKLVDMQYSRNDTAFSEGEFRVRGDTIDVRPPYGDIFVRIVLDTGVENLSLMNPVSGKLIESVEKTRIYPAGHYMVPFDKKTNAFDEIRAELAERVSELKSLDKDLEAQRIEQRTNYDLEMLSEVGYVSGIENYSMHLSGRKPGDSPETLLDFFPKDFLTFIDESHVTVPQIRGMYRGDRSRKQTLVDYGFRLPSALENRPLRFDEFFKCVGYVVFVSATPADYEREVSGQIAEQVIRPTGLLDPEVLVRPSENQIDDLLAEIRERIARKERVLVTTLTKRMAEDLAEHLTEIGVKCRYLHSDVDTLERVDILRDLRLGEFDVLVGINLLREGLDLPEVSLVAILDADREGFLRSETSLIQTMGRVSRNVCGTVILFADKVTGSMERAMRETVRRRALQLAYNRKHGITPETVRKRIHNRIVAEEESRVDGLSDEELGKLVAADLTREMKKAAKQLDFERAAKIRDMIKEKTG